MDEVMDSPHTPTEKHDGFGPISGFFLIFLATLIGFFAGLALSITGVAIVSAMRGVHPNFSLTYRYFAPPVAFVFFIGSIVYFVKHRG